MLKVHASVYAEATHKRACPATESLLAAAVDVHNLQPTTCPQNLTLTLCAIVDVAPAAATTICSHLLNFRPANSEIQNHLPDGPANNNCDIFMLKIAEKTSQYTVYTVSLIVAVTR